jgi:hypothetical protein
VRTRPPKWNKRAARRPLPTGCAPTSSWRGIGWPGAGPCAAGRNVETGERVRIPCAVAACERGWRRLRYVSLRDPLGVEYPGRALRAPSARVSRAVVQWGADSSAGARLECFLLNPTQRSQRAKPPTASLACTLYRKQSGVRVAPAGHVRLRRRADKNCATSSRRLPPQVSFTIRGGAGRNNR